MTPQEQASKKAERLAQRLRPVNPPRADRPEPPSPMDTTQPHSMEEDWTTAYGNSKEFKIEWFRTHGHVERWPQGVQLLQGKMYKQGRLCMPESKVEQVLQEFHRASGHVGNTRLEKEWHHRYLATTEKNIKQLIQELRKQCKTCQACEPPHYQKEGAIVHFPIPERLMHSVSLDVCSMQPTLWKEKEYDSLLLCVDRLSGWIIGCPTKKQGVDCRTSSPPDT